MRLRRSQVQFIQELLFFGMTMFMAAAAIAVFTPVSFTTVDDRQGLIEYLEQNPSRQVLGAQTEFSEFAGCSEEKPIIGWIDYNGQKIIVESLPEGHIASQCFTHPEAAQKAGYDYKL